MRANPNEQFADGQISVRVGRTMKIIPFTQVPYLCSDTKYTVLPVEGGPEILIETALTWIEANHGDVFLRVHRGMLVNRDYVERMELNKLSHAGWLWLRNVVAPVRVSRRELTNVRDFLTHKRNLAIEAADQVESA